MLNEGPTLPGSSIFLSIERCDQVSQVKDQVGQGQGQELDNIIIHKLGVINILILQEDTMEIIYILSFNSDDGIWEEVDQLQRNRYEHGVKFGDSLD